jgi:tRNA(Ile)-lysidine synthase
LGALEPPLTAAELDRALTAIGGFERRPFVAVAVSGGPDSLALAILVDRWARARGGEGRALIVDHGLRPESAAEAATVGGWLAARGIPYAVLPWPGEKPTTGIQEAARAARYRLLADWCAAHGCLHLLTAHHRDDQAETYLIRHRAGSFVDGLAGMSVVRELPQIRLVRPLLGVAKARLIALLDAEGQEYLQDPSNRNPAFERSRLRMAATPEGAEMAIAEIHVNGSARIERERALAALLARAVALHPAGFAALDPAPIAAAGELGERALGRIAATLGGAAYPLRRQRLARLCRALGTAPMPARTLGGYRFVSWRGRVLVLREGARAAPPLTLAPGMSALWDRRFAVHLTATASRPVTIRQLGAAGVAALREDRIVLDNSLPRLIYPTLPAIWDEHGLASVPHLFYQRATATHLPALAFRPSVSLFGVGFTVV